MLAVENDDVGCLAAVFLLHQDVAMAERAVGLRTHVERFLLLLHKLLVEIEVIGLQDVVAAGVNGNLERN